MPVSVTQTCMWVCGTDDLIITAGHLRASPWHTAPLHLPLLGQNCWPHMASGFSAALWLKALRSEDEEEGLAERGESPDQPLPQDQSGALSHALCFIGLHTILSCPYHKSCQCPCTMLQVLGQWAVICATWSVCVCVCVSERERVSMCVCVCESVCVCVCVRA